MWQPSQSHLLRRLGRTVLPQQGRQRGSANAVSGMVEQLAASDLAVVLVNRMDDVYSLVMTSSRFRIIEATTVHAATAGAFGSCVISDKPWAAVGSA